MRSTDPPPSTTSRCAAGATINMKRSWSSGRARRGGFVRRRTAPRGRAGPDGRLRGNGATMGAMRVRLLVVAILVLAVRAPSPVARADAPTRKVWVYFRDKGPDPRLDTAALSPRARARRALRGSTKGVT